MADIDDLDVSLLGETKRSLERIQSFNPELLVRREHLGAYDFEQAVPAAKRIIDLFGTLPISHLVHFPDQQLAQIRATADNIFSVFQNFLNFDLASAQPSVPQARDTLIQSLQNHFQNTFNVLDVTPNYHPVLIRASALLLPMWAGEARGCVA